MHERTFPRTLTNDATAPVAVRRLVQAELERRGHPDVVPDAQLLASEVVTNAVIHTHCPDCTVLIEVDGDRVRISVTDCEPDLTPVLLPPDPARFGGLGMRIVDDVARSWGCVVRGSTKTVWFELADAPAGHASA